MLPGISGTERICMYAGAADLRNGVDELSRLVTNCLRQDPHRVMYLFHQPYPDFDERIDMGIQ
jgi:hypothetical protein